MMVRDMVIECRVGWIEGIGQSECGRFVTGNLRIKLMSEMVVTSNYKDRVQGRVVGDIVSVESLLRGGTIAGDKLRSTIRSKLEMLKKSRVLTNGNSSSSEQLVDGAAVNHDTTSSINTPVTATITVPTHTNDQEVATTKSGAPLTILEKMKFLKSAEEYGSGAGGGSEESVAYVSNIARCVKEKLEIARKQFDESYGSSDRIIPNDVKEEAVYPMAAERIISGSNDFKSCSQDMDEKLAASRKAAEATAVKTNEVHFNGGKNDDLTSVPCSTNDDEKKDTEEVVALGNKLSYYFNFSFKVLLVPRVI